MPISFFIISFIFFAFIMSSSVIMGLGLSVSAVFPFAILNTSFFCILLYKCDGSIFFCNALIILNLRTKFILPVHYMLFRIRGISERNLYNVHYRVSRTQQHRHCKHQRIFCKYLLIVRLRLLPRCRSLRILRTNSYNFSLKALCCNVQRMIYIHRRIYDTDQRNC